MPPAPAPFTPRQVEILTAAAELLRDEGLAGLTVRRLAERVGFSEAALYRHFAGKEELLVALMGWLAEERLLPPMRQVAGDDSLPAAERLRRAFRHQLATLAELRGMPFLFIAEALASGDERLVAQARRVAGELSALFTRLLAELPSRPGDPPPAERATILFGFAAGAALRMRVLGETPSDEWLQVGDFLVRLLTKPHREDA